MGKDLASFGKGCAAAYYRPPWGRDNKTMIRDEMTIWSESYIGPERRYRLRRLAGGTRSGVERRHAPTVDDAMEWGLGKNRRRTPRRSAVQRRTCKDRRHQ